MLLYNYILIEIGIIIANIENDIHQGCFLIGKVYISSDRIPNPTSPLEMVFIVM